MIIKVDGVEVKTTGLDDFTEDEARRYVDYVFSNADPQELKDAEEISIEVKLCDDGKVDVGYTLQGKKFERIRRITGKGIAVHSQAV